MSGGTDGKNDITSSHDRNSLRRTLLANGFEPLPLDGKACFIPGWSHVEITSDWLDGFRRNGRYANTGIRCGNVVAIDVDCDDPDLADLVEECVEESLGETAWCRWGRGSRRLLVYWTDEPGRKLRTGRYGGQQVEVLGLGCQFAAFGIHPTTGEPYRWDSISPLDGSVDELPGVKRAQVEVLIERLEPLLAATGRPLESPGGQIWETPQHDYVLTDDMVFDCLDHGMLTVAELREAGADGWPCNLTAIRPTSDSQGGMVRRGGDGSVVIVDFVTGVTYRERLDLQVDDDAGAALNAALAAARLVPGGIFEPPARTTLQELTEDYCYVMSDGTVRRFAAPTVGVKLASFSQGKRAWVIDGASRKLLVNYWLENGAVVCERAEFVPTSSERVLVLDGVRVLNTYVAPAHPQEGGTTGLFWDFMDGLIPDPVERALLVDWIATKVQRPWLRMHGMVVASELTGTGRGTLVEIMSRLIGPAYCKAMKLGHVFGSTYQSQYSDWLDGTLMTTIAEASDSSHAHANDWHARKRAYEAIKETVETQASRQFVVRKGVASGSITVYASLFIATNNADALAIDSGDRRLIVLTGGRVRAAEFYRRLHAWLGVAENIGALWRELRDRQCTYDPFAPAPMTGGKARMVAASQSELDQLWVLFCAEAPGDLFTAQQWFAYIGHMQHDAGYVLQENWRGAATALLSAKAHRLSDDPSWQIRFPGTSIRVRPWCLRNVDKWRNFCHTGENSVCVTELLKNGDPTQKVAKLTGPPWTVTPTP